jgi:hypothetical protein
MEGFSALCVIGASASIIRWVRLSRSQSRRRVKGLATAKCPSGQRQTTPHLKADSRFGGKGQISSVKRKELHEFSECNDKLYSQ